jgi:hypothetical protein
MSVDQQNQALQEFDASSIGFSKGALSLVLVLTRNAKQETFPVDPKTFETTRGGQVAGLGGGAVKKILAEHGIKRVLSAEGGRTSRGNMERMRLYLDILNRLATSGDLDLVAAERFWVDRVVNYFDSMPFSFKLDPSKSLRACIRNLLDQAVERQREATGTMYAGAMMQHLVGAKLKIVSPIAVVIHGHAVADGPTKRSADFALGDAAIHVTTAPSAALLDKCVGNLSVGLRPIIVTTEDGAGGARALARQSGIEDRIDVIEIEQFLTANVYERSGFERDARSEFIRMLIDGYNTIVSDAESDPSLRIEFDD